MTNLIAFLLAAGATASTSYDESWEQVSRKGKGNVTRGQEAVQGGHSLTSQIFGGAVQVSRLVDCCAMSETSKLARWLC